MAGSNKIEKTEKIRVKVIGFDGLINSMFKKTKWGGRKEYCVMQGDETNTPDLVCFIGGADVNPKLYDESPLDETYFSDDDDKRDLEAFDKYKDIPKVGICRGGQFLNVLSGGQMWQHVNAHGGSHTVTNLLPMERKNFKVGDTFIVTSTHHQMMIPGKEGEVLACVHYPEKDTGRASIFKSATKRDKPVFDTEVLWYKNTNSLCFQPHPEYMTNDMTEEYFFALLNYFWFGGK